MVELFAMDITSLPTEGSEEYEKCVSALMHERRERIRKCSHSEKRKQMLGAGVLLGWILERNGIEPIAVRNGVYGKLTAEGICFNLSHSGDIVICAVGKRSVGCDIEKVKPITKKVAERFFCRGEQAYLNAYEDEAYDLQFCRLWTMKESYVKMVGEGFHLSPVAFEVEIEEDIRVLREGQGQTGYFREYQIPGYCVTVCAEEDEFSNLQWFRFERSKGDTDINSKRVQFK